MNDKPETRRGVLFPGPRAVFSLSIALALVISGGAVLAYGQWVDARTPVPKADSADVGGPTAWAGHEHQFVAALWVQEGGNGSLDFQDPAGGFLEVPRGAYEYDPATGAITISPDAPIYPGYVAAFLVRESDDPQAEERLFTLRFQGSTRFEVLPAEGEDNRSTAPLGLYAMATPSFLTLETRDVSAALTDSEDCRVHWQYDLEDGVKADSDWSPSGSSRLNPLTWRITGGDAIRLAFEGDAPGCPDLRFRMEHLGLQERPG